MTSLISIPVAITVTPPVPAYVSNLATFQSRELVGAYGPSGSLGKALPLAAALQGWATSSGGGVNGLVYDTHLVIPDYCGGVEDRTNKRVLWSGGGHRSTACNGVFYYDFKDDGTGRPRGAFGVKGSFSALSAVPFNSPIPAVWADGRPNSVHTTSGLAYCASNDRFYQLVVTNVYTGDQEGGGAVNAWCHVGNNNDWPANPWNTGIPHAGNWIYAGVGEWSLHSPDGTKVLHGIHAEGTQPARFFNMLTASWGNMVSIPNSPDYPYYANMVWDSIRNRALYLGAINARPRMRLDVDWVNETVRNSASINLSGDLAGLDRGGTQSIVFDPTRRYRGTGTQGVVWVYGGRNPQSNMTDITEIDPVNMTAVRYPLTGTIPVQGQNPGGGVYRPAGSTLSGPRMARVVCGDKHEARGLCYQAA